MRKKDYPFYETTVFEDFRIMTENVAEKYPDRVAVSYKENPKDKETKKITYSQAREYIRNLGTGMISLGARDKHIAIIGESSPEWMFSYFALMSIGAVTVPIDKDLPPNDMKSILISGKCEMVFFSQSVEKKLLEISDDLTEVSMYVSMGEAGELESKSIKDIVKLGGELYSQGDNSYYDYEIDVDRMATIVFTSGTTGKGKGVMLSQKNIVLDMTNGMYLFQMTPKTMNFLPPHHTFGSTVNLVGHYAQGIEIYITSGLRYIATELTEQQPSHLILVPLFVEKLYEKIWKTAKESGKDKILKIMLAVSNALRKVKIDLRKLLFKNIRDAFGGKLELIVCGGAPLNQKIIDFFESVGIVILNGYGITECSPLVTCNRNEYRKKGSVGRSILHQDLKIKDPDENGEGEICVRGPNVMLGYYNDPEATAAAFDDEGYFLTGDYGRLDEENWLYITGRIKNIIVLSNGKNVYPEEIENEIASVPGVSEVIVYSGESRSGSHKEVIVAEIFPDADTLKASGIDNFQEYFENEIKSINERMVSYKAVGQIKIRDEEFPKNTSRKILRFEIDKTID